MKKVFRVLRFGRAEDGELAYVLVQGPQGPVCLGVDVLELLCCAARFVHEEGGELYELHYDEGQLMIAPMPPEPASTLVDLGDDEAMGLLMLNERARAHARIMRSTARLGMMRAVFNASFPPEFVRWMLQQEDTSRSVAMGAAVKAGAAPLEP